MAAAEDISLDVPEPQILLNFPGDANGFFHHHRLLLKRLSPGRWIALSPDYELETIDLNARQHIVLGRRSPFPAHLLPEIYASMPLMSSLAVTWKATADVLPPWQWC